MVLLGYNHLTTIATTDALAPLHFPKPTATYGMVVADGMAPVCCIMPM